MEKKSSISSVVIVAVLSGIVAIVVVDALFTIFPSGWLFFLIPVIMGFSLKKFAKFPKDLLEDDDEFEKLSKKVGLLCAGICLVAMVVAVVPIYMIVGSVKGVNILEIILSDVFFYAACVVCIYFGYSKGKEVVTNAYYDSIE